MIVELRKENEKYDEVKIATLPSRLNEIKGDIKTRNEIIREVLHNSIAEIASKIDIKIKKVNKEKVDILIDSYGEQLNFFSNIESIIRMLLEADVSTKRNQDYVIGGKGRGAKVLLSASKLVITSKGKGRINKIIVEEPNKQIEEMLKNGDLLGDKNNFIVNVINDNEEINESKSSINYRIEGVYTNNIKYFEHNSLIKYLRYFTILAGIKNNKVIPENLEVNVQGLVNDVNKEGYRTREVQETLSVENTFERIRQYATKNNCLFSCIKCSNGEIECLNGKLHNEELLKMRIKDEEIKILKEFFYEDECFIFRTKDRKLKNEIKMNSVDNDSEFFGIYAANEGVMIQERFDGLSKVNANNAGGNLFAQYFGYVNTRKVNATGDRNRIEGNNEFFEYKNQLSTKVMPIINKILSIYDTDEKIPKGEDKEPVKKTGKIIDLIEKKDTRIIQGLWAELNHILNHPKLIEGWVAHQRLNNRRRPHDFEYDMTFDEIKSKVIDEDKDILYISSVSQLDDSRTGSLYIYYLKSNVASSKEGKNIIEIINEVSNIIESEQKNNLFNGIGNYLSIENFQDKFLKVDLKNYVTKLDKYVVVKIEKYKVDDNFPCLRQKDIERSCLYIGKDGYKLNLTEVKNRVTPIEISF